MGLVIECGKVEAFWARVSSARRRSGGGTWWMLVRPALLVAWAIMGRSGLVHGRWSLCEDLSNWETKKQR